MPRKVRLHTGDGVLEYRADDGENLLEFLRRNSVSIASPCGGKGTCGKCRVRVRGIPDEPAEKEKSLLGSQMISKGYRLACYNTINSDLDLYLDAAGGEASITTEAKERRVKLDPVTRKIKLEMELPSLESQVSDVERIEAFCGYTMDDSPAFMAKIPEILRLGDFKITAVVSRDRIISVEPGDTSGKLYGVAVDIGTTTIAAYLVDLVKGKKAGVCSMLNPQAKFGADVLSRIDYTLNRPDGLKELKETIVDCINEAIAALCRDGGIRENDIYTMVFVGNTTMMHLLMGIPPKFIATAPFVPVTTKMHRIKAGELGININENGQAIAFPSVSAYIGADTIAAVLSSRMHLTNKISLLIDIGTNGEMVLGNRDWLYACSTAAGPAFEGARIRDGIGGVKGAIDTVSFSPSVRYTTIGGARPLGICGSGIVDCIAAMLSHGVIDETGRMVDSDEAADLPPDLAGRLVEVDGAGAFRLVDKEESALNSDILVTQRDVRELQNAKAAIAAGVRVLVEEAGIKMDDIDRVYLAGGFGNHINVDSAFTIGLLPRELKGKVESIGNAAGNGAVEGLLSRRLLAQAEAIKKKIRYIELSAYPAFSDLYIDCMLFE